MPDVPEWVLSIDALLASRGFPAARAWALRWVKVFPRRTRSGLAEIVYDGRDDHWGFRLRKGRYLDAEERFLRAWLDGISIDDRPRQARAWLVANLDRVLAEAPEMWKCLQRHEGQVGNALAERHGDWPPP